MGAHDMGDGNIVFTKADQEIPVEPIWGYNCLTAGIHHGRPDQLWNIPLRQIAQMFTVEEIKDLIVTRIYQDAMVYVRKASFSKDWADLVQELAKHMAMDTFNRTLDTVTHYYGTVQWSRSVEHMLELLHAGTLSMHYKPLHSHDSLNQVCRAVGTSCSIEAAKTHPQHD